VNRSPFFWKHLPRFPKILLHFTNFTRFIKKKEERKEERKIPFGAGGVAKVVEHFSKCKALS
jgi:hypothetical protein